jgi:hypothetical protein
MVASGVSLAGRASAQPRMLPPFCSLQNPISSYAAQVYRSTGDRTLDSQLDSELKSISGEFKVLPGFLVIDDGRQPNAFATTKTEISGTRGTVLFGTNLLMKELRAQEWGGTAVAGILAHEFGHIFQYSTPLHQNLAQGQATERLVELHADFLAGYYLGLKKRVNGGDIMAFARSIYSKGDWNFNSPGHHGTPEERVKSMLGGYKFSLQNGHDIRTAAAAGVRLVRSI